MRKYNLVVCGGGLTGVAAAIQAKRSGVGSVLLIERYGFLGGMATAGLVNPFMPYWKQGVLPSEGGQLVFGLFDEIRQRLHEMEGYDYEGDHFDAECMKIVLQRMCLEAGVRILFHTMVSEVTETELGADVTLTAKGEKIHIRAGALIDATGDADVCRLSGENTETFKQGNIPASWYYSTVNGENKLTALGFSDIPDLS